MKCQQALIFDPQSAKASSFLQEARKIAATGKNEIEIADKLVEHVNHRVFTKDTAYDLATGTTDREFFRAMTRDSKTLTTTMDDLYAIGRADCRGRNLQLAAEMRAAGIADARVVNTTVIAAGVSQDHTLVKYTVTANGKSTTMIADAYFREFNGSLAELVQGKFAKTGRWLDPMGPVNGYTRIIIEQQNYPNISTIGINTK